MEINQIIRWRILLYVRLLLYSSMFVFNTSCTDWIYDDRSGCDSGVYLSFRYDYNLQRVDMFADYVGGITVYVFDTDGNFVMKQSEANLPGSAPLRFKDYRMHLDLPAGYLPFCGTCHAERGGRDTSWVKKQNFVLADPEGGKMEDLSVELEHAADGRGGT